MTTAPSSPPDSPTQLAARIAELAVSVPFELSARLVEVVPAVADKVPAAADRVRREMVLARFIGKMAVDQGLRELRDRLVPADEPATAPAVPAERAVDVTPAPAAVEEPVSASAEPAEPAASAGSTRSVTADELALADYDHLSSAQIVAKLSGLEPSERAEIGAYERSHRHRRTILGKIDQLGVT